MYDEWNGQVVWIGTDRRYLILALCSVLLFVILECGRFIVIYHSII